MSDKPRDINPQWRWTILLEDLVNRSKRGSNIYHRVISPTEQVEVVPAIAYESTIRERDEARAELEKLRIVAEQLERWRFAWASQDFSDQEPARRAMFKALDYWLDYKKESP